MNFLDVIILGIVEGVTEFLPISSTAHLQLVERLLGISSTDFVQSFTLIIQVGALFGTALYIWKKRTLFKFNWAKIIVACIPTLVVGFVLYTLIKRYFFGNFTLIAWALILGGVIMLVAEQFHQKYTGRPRVITFKKSFLLGLAQSLAVIPGVSRSGAVLVAGYFSHIEKKQLAQFTFLIGLPVAFAASAYDVIKTGFVFTSSEILMTVLGLILSGIFSYFASGWFLNIIVRYSLRVFAWYRIIVGVIILIFWGL